jgi:hypothetical protein
MNQRIPISTRRSQLGRAVATMFAVMGLALPTSTALAQKVSPEAAPRAWVAYAENVNGKVIEWLRADDEAAVRLRTYVDGLRPAADQSSPPITLRVWIDAKGVITRVEFTPFAHETANQDLRGLLVARSIGARPPRGMLLPLLLAVQLDPVPQPVPTATTGVTTDTHAVPS